MDSSGSSHLVDALTASGVAFSPVVRAAFLGVDRGLFLPPETPSELAYGDVAVVTKTDATGRPVSSASQPSIVARMLMELELAAGQHVLEIGTGTGYNAALIRAIVGNTGRVTTVEVDAKIAQTAQSALAAAGANVEVVTGDGISGCVARPRHSIE